MNLVDVGRMLRRAAVVLALCSGCSESDRTESGRTEPVRTDSGQAIVAPQTTIAEAKLEPPRAKRHDSDDPGEMITAPTIKTIAELNSLNAMFTSPIVLHVDVDWSATAVVSRPVVRKLFDEIRRDPNLREVVVRRIDCTSQSAELTKAFIKQIDGRGFDMLDPDRKSHVGVIGGGNGGLVWIEHGMIQHSVDSAAQIGTDELLTRTRKLFAPQPHDRISRSDPEPAELQWSCAVQGDDENITRVVERLDDSDPTTRLDAAWWLWRNRNRRHAAEALKVVDAFPATDTEANKLRAEIARAYEPAALARELGEGDCEWAAWLAYLRPRPEFVPALSAVLADRPQFGEGAALALGASRDPRAREPLLKFMTSEEYVGAGFAALALAELGDRQVEPQLIQALKRRGWTQVCACQALGAIGTQAAVPELTKLAVSQEYTGVLDISGAAGRAIEEIKKREPR